MPGLIAAAALGTLTLAGSWVARAGDEATPLEQSYALERAADWAGAAAAMERAVREQQRSYFRWYRLGYLQLQAGNHAAASEAYGRAAALEAKAVEPLLGQQQAFLAQADYAAAVRSGDALLERDARNFLGLSRTAWALYKLGRFVPAIEQYRTVLTYYPGDIEMRMGLGWSLLGAEKYDAARAAFQEVLDMVPGHAGAQEGLEACKATPPPTATPGGPRRGRGRH
ncbi:MAG: tetratricopeptide repeat protein [Planctomycetes bacterium]|nr:tetratricopeptide repeat protein [Planctomycetota bacterium]